MTNESPIFIVGHPRSGTTLLRFMLSSHSRIHIPDETGFVPFLRPDVSAPLSTDQVTAVVHRIGRLNRFWADMVPDIDEFYRALPEPTLSAVLDALYRQRIAEFGAARWGDKTPLYVQYIPTLLTLFPQANFIHMIRDGRDAALSALAKWGAERRYLDVFYLMVNWNRNVRAGCKAKNIVPAGQYAEFHYEELVSTPEVIIRRVCEFLGEEFEPAMLKQNQLAARVGGGIDAHIEVQRPISDSSVGRWRQELNPFQKKLADRLAGSTLTEFGYELAALGPMSPAEILHFAGSAARFLALDTTRTLLYRVGLLSLNRNRRQTS